EVADRPMPLALPWLRDQLRPQLDAFLQSLDEESLSTMAVGEALQRALAGGLATDLESVAAVLGWNPRTLRARLASEGTSFSDILDARRKEYALRQMTYPGVKLASVAMELGFSDQASFTRAFRRWTGSTPSGWMETHGGPGPRAWSTLPGGK
ncbi:MAG TPA: helix-turn-helix transcriptional regulator, partial [bacterium]